MRRGYTLVELLVVITIMVILVALALPIAKKVLESSHARSGSRQLQSYVAMAKAHAAQHGRPAGVILLCEQPPGAEANVRQVTKLYLAEQPAAYGGDTQSATAVLNFSVGNQGPWPLTLYHAGSFTSLVGSDAQFQIRFSAKGPWYGGYTSMTGAAFVYGMGGQDTGFGRAGIDDDGDMMVDEADEYLAHNSDDPIAPIPHIPPPTPLNPNGGAPFQIRFQPRPIGAPMELTEGSAIDLTLSGVGTSGTDFNTATTAIAIMFQPSGAVESIYVDSVQSHPVGTMHFLLGKPEKVANPLAPNPEHVSNLMMFDPQYSNLADPDSLWVSIGSSTGTVTTSDNVVPSPWANFSATGQQQYLATCRQFARGREQTGGQ